MDETHLGKIVRHEDTYSTGGFTPGHIAGEPAGYMETVSRKVTEYPFMTEEPYDKTGVDSDDERMTMDMFIPAYDKKIQDF